MIWNLLRAVSAAALLHAAPSAAAAQWGEEAQQENYDRQAARDEAEQQRESDAMSEHGFCEAMGGPGCDDGGGSGDEGFGLGTIAAGAGLVVVAGVVIAGAYALASLFEDEPAEPPPANTQQARGTRVAGSGADVAPRPAEIRLTTPTSADDEASDPTLQPAPVRAAGAAALAAGSEPSPTAVKAALALMVTMLLVVSALTAATSWRLFAKAGKPGWIAWVPIYNWWTYLELAGLPGWLMFVPFANAIVTVVVAPFGLAQRFGRSTAFGFGLLLAGAIFYPVLAFGSSRYVPDRPPQGS